MEMNVCNTHGNYYVSKCIECDDVTTSNYKKTKNYKNRNSESGFLNLMGKYAIGMGLLIVIGWIFFTL